MEMSLTVVMSLSTKLEMPPKRFVFQQELISISSVLEMSSNNRDISVHPSIRSNFPWFKCFRKIDIFIPRDALETIDLC